MWSAYVMTMIINHCPVNNLHGLLRITSWQHEKEVFCSFGGISRQEMCIEPKWKEHFYTDIYVLCSLFLSDLFFSDFLHFSLGSLFWGAGVVQFLSYVFYSFFFYYFFSFSFFISFFFFFGFLLSLRFVYFFFLQRLSFSFFGYS